MIEISELMSIVGNNVVRYRKSRGMTSEQLAHCSEISPKLLGEIERGKQNTTLKTLEHIASALKIEPHQLLVEHSDKEYEEYNMSAIGKLASKLPSVEQAALLNAIHGIESLAEHLVNKKMGVIDESAEG